MQVLFCLRFQAGTVLAGLNKEVKKDQTKDQIKDTTRFPAMIPVMKHTITFSMAVLILQIPSSVDLDELKKLNLDQIDSRIENLKSDLAKGLADDQRKLKSEIKWLELKKSLDALN